MGIRPRATRALRRLPAAEASERRLKRRVGLIWGLLVLNVLTFYPHTWSGQPLILPIPSAIGKTITQGALPAALVMAVIVNRRLIVRPSVFLGLISLLVVEAFINSLQARHFGTIYRASAPAVRFRALAALPMVGRRTCCWSEPRHHDDGRAQHHDSRSHRLSVPPLGGRLGGAFLPTRRRRSPSSPPSRSGSCSSCGWPPGSAAGHAVRDLYRRADPLPVAYQDGHLALVLASRGLL